MLSIRVKAMGRRPVSSLAFTAVLEPCHGVQAWPVKKWDKGALGKQTGSWQSFPASTPSEHAARVHVGSWRGFLSSMSGDNHLQEARVSQCEDKERMLKKTGGKEDRIARSNMDLRRGITLSLKVRITSSAFH